MKLVALRAKGIYGQFSLNLRFNPDLNILVGANGSGKTTTLRLIHGLLGASLEDLYQIPFERLQVAVELPKKQVSHIEASRDGGALNISIDRVSEPLVLPLVDSPDLSRLLRKQNSESSLASFLAPHCANNPTWRALKEMGSPLFLGIDRRGGLNDSEDEGIRHYRDFANRMKHVTAGPQDGMTEVQSLLSSEYRRLRAIQEGQARSLRKAVILSAFKYSELSSKDIEGMERESLQMQQQQLVARQSEIRTALQSVDAESADVLREVDNFFKKLNALYKQMERSHTQDEPNFNIEWLMNKAQIERITTLLEVIDSHRSSIDKLFASTTRFLTAANSFYSDSRKRVVIDEVGQLSVESIDKQVVPVSALSSGERQVLLMLGQLFFRRDRRVFIIDEPELSLHIRWQKIFVEKAMEAQKNNQLILATHSPEIVGEYREKCITVRATA
ncbi:AAA family ATPase [Pseudoxanthomonas mexicana]|uniref:AAA family ATPase n=1 Tax=Pseudoxanthomonas mexicana TaxID=128785 RepID=UPI0018DB697C|nr:AAA family ATPase [Pseudoxanthomonas mexicana]